MNNKLILFPNEPNHTPEKQFDEIQVALLGVNSWANKISQEISNIGPGTQGPIGNTGPQGPAGPSGVSPTPYTLVHAEVPTGDVDGVNNVYRTAGQIIDNDVIVFKNGLALQPVTEYLATVSTITMATPPPINSKMLVGYHWDTATVPPAWDANVIGAWDLHTDYADGTVYGNDLAPEVLNPSFTSYGGRQCPTNFVAESNFYHFPTAFGLLVSGLSQWTLEFQIYATTNPNNSFVGLNDLASFYTMGEGYMAPGWFYVNKDNADFNYAPTGFIPNVWQAISLVKDATTMKLYIEGSLISNTASTWTWNALESYRSVIGGNWYFQTPTSCSMRNVVFSNIARTTFPTVKV